jgi:hypothetical protein
LLSCRWSLLRKTRRFGQGRVRFWLLGVRPLDPVRMKDRDPIPSRKKRNWWQQKKPKWPQKFWSNGTSFCFYRSKNNWLIFLWLKLTWRNSNLQSLFWSPLWTDVILYALNLRKSTHLHGWEKKKNLPKKFFFHSHFLLFRHHVKTAQIKPQ